MQTKQTNRADNTIKAKEMAKGATVEGYLKSFVKTESNFNGKAKTEEHPLLVAKDGKTTLVWKAGNITSAIKEALELNDAPLGSYVKIKCAGPLGEFKTPEGIKRFNKFIVSVDSDDVLAGSNVASPVSGTSGGEF